MPAPPKIIELVQKFEAHKADYRAPKYNETQLRNDFLDLFLLELGWDIGNELKAPEATRDVILEFPDTHSGKNKRPDYCLRIGGAPKFYVEAKKPSVNIRENNSAAFQTRSYGWNASLPFCVLSDFDGLSIYDCRFEPSLDDGAGVALHKYLKHEEYAERWDEIAELFSREAVLAGSLEIAAARNKRKGTITVDEAFLKLIEAARTELAERIAQSNAGISQRDLNFAVQQTIDRIIFLRICEDRDMEAWGQLQGLRSDPGIYPRLVEMFRRADARYNSGLFHFSPAKSGPDTSDTLTLGLSIPDRPLERFIQKLYRPYAYNFSIMPVEMLGQVYEQFLGKVIRLDGSGRAIVEDKPEVKKAGGVYYTPSYIVGAIVRQTVGVLCEGKKPEQVAKLTILDPACGSGSFLLGPYSFLLDWHLNWFTSNDPEKWAKQRNAPILRAPIAPGAASPSTKSPQWRLSTRLKKEILLNNIHGVDIDRQAVEVTKLSLLLKVLEGENSQTLQLQLLQERALPDLESNIKCGNSLIESDFYAQEGLQLSDEEEERVNVFDWSKGFPAIFKSGGFDAVIGNPPYIRIQALREWAPREASHYSRRYKSASKGNYDIYVVFVERGLALLNASGLLGYILPNKFFVTDYGSPLRGLLTSRNAVDAVIDFRDAQVFGNATTYTCLLFLSGQAKSHVDYQTVDPSAAALEPYERRFLSATSLSSAPWNFSSEPAQVIYKKIHDGSIPLLNLPTDIARGSSSGADDIFMLRMKEGGLVTHAGEPVEIEEDLLRIPIFATDFGRYSFRPKTTERLIFPYGVKTDGYSLISEQEFERSYPKAYKYLQEHREALETRKHSGTWFGFSAPRSLNVHGVAQLVVPLLANKGMYCELPLDMNRYSLMAGGGFSISISEEHPLSPRYILGVLNSSLLFWQLKAISNIFRGGWITCTKQYIGTLPIRAIDFTNAQDVEQHDKMVALVERMLKLQRDVVVEKNPASRERLARRIDSTDAAIDALVFELYGLNEKEIALVKGL